MVEGASEHAAALMSMCKELGAEHVDLVVKDQSGRPTMGVIAFDDPDLLDYVLRVIEQWDEAQEDLEHVEVKNDD